MRKHNINVLLAMANGVLASRLNSVPRPSGREPNSVEDWKSSQITHHCRFGCCANAAESRAGLKRCHSESCPSPEVRVRGRKLWCAVLDVVFARRPPVPVLSRWLTCAAAARFVMCATKLYRVSKFEFQFCWLLQRG